MMAKPIWATFLSTVEQKLAGGGGVRQGKDSRRRSSVPAKLTLFGNKGPIGPVIGGSIVAWVISCVHWSVRTLILQSRFAS